ncbi:MAG: cell division protein FtsQ/DivIB [Pseudomonadota bacterium]
MPSFEALQQHIVERPWRAGLYTFGVLALATFVLLAADTVLRPESFAVRSLSFEGEFRHVDQQALTAAVMESVRGNFFLLDLDAIRERARTVPWVHGVTVRRHWPDGVHIRFSEQQLVARWGKSGWVNAQGEHVHLQRREGPAGLPLLTGPDGMQQRVLEHYRSLNDILAPVQLQVAALTLSDRHSWNIVLHNGLVLTLGREEPEPKVERFARVYPRALAAQVARAKRVDLRYTNGFSVEWANRTGAPRASEIMATGLNEG